MLGLKGAIEDAIKERDAKKAARQTTRLNTFRHQHEEIQNLFHSPAHRARRVLRVLLELQLAV
jgi:hypothetical protein